jgi:fructuronate reductase
VNVAAARVLTRRDFGAPSPATRIVHFGLGSFHRAHQVWFTAHAGDGDEWGICSFTGRGPGIVDSLQRQDGLYTLIERSASTDHFEVMTNLVEVYEGSDTDAIVGVFSRPEVVVVTTTVTESGYRIGLDGTAHMDDPELARDIATLHAVSATDHLGSLALSTIPGRILLGLEARRRANVGPIAIVPCDNLPKNGLVLEKGLTQLVVRISTELTLWMEENVTFASTSVDRITPHATDRDIAIVARETQWLDEAPVVTEPFASWVIAGNFPAGRPLWEEAGALFVDDIEPYEHRKLWLLNGAHSVLANLGLEAGHDTVAEAVEDPRCRRTVEAFWSSAAHHLPEDLDLDLYCSQLIERFQNPRMEYQLEQIASDSVMKLRTRIAPVVVAEFAARRDCDAGAEALAAWIRLVRARGSFPDAESSAVNAIVDGATPVVVELIRLVDARLVELELFVDQVEQLVDQGADVGDSAKT